MSRHDDSGCDLPPEALTIDQVVDDVAAVLDDAQVDKAVIYGTSYGTYVAAGVGVRHPDRVHAMVLDSPLLSAADIDDVRDATRRLLWDGDDPETAELAAKVRQLVDDGVLSPRPRNWPRRSTGSRGPMCWRANSTCCWPGGDGCGRRRPGRPGCCSSARRRIATSRTWSAGSATANSTTGRCPTVSRSTLPCLPRDRHGSQRISKPNRTTSSQRCPSSVGRRWSSPVAAI